MSQCVLRVALCTLFHTGRVQRIRPTSSSPLVSAVHALVCVQHRRPVDYTLPRLRTKFAERAFSYAGPSAWNGLSDDLRAVADPAEFRKHLKAYFLLQLIMFIDICSRQR